MKHILLTHIVNAVLFRFPILLMGRIHYSGKCIGEKESYRGKRGKRSHESRPSRRFRPRVPRNSGDKEPCASSHHTAVAKNNLHCRTLSPCRLRMVAGVHLICSKPWFLNLQCSTASMHHKLLINLYSESHVFSQLGGIRARVFGTVIAGVIFGKNTKFRNHGSYASDDGEY